MTISRKFPDQELIHYRQQVALRTLLAIAGGYLLTNLLGVFLSYALPLSKSDAVVTASVLSFAIFTAAIIWVFSVKSLRQAWLGLAVPGIALEALILLIEFAQGGL